MKHLTNTIRAALAILESIGENDMYTEEWQKTKQALTALSEFEAMGAEQEPCGWFESPYGAFRANPLLNVTFPASTLTWQIPAFIATPPAQQPQEIEVQCPVCNHKFFEWPNDKQPQAEAVPAVDRVYEAAKRLVDHADFQLGGVLSAKSKARDIPSNAASKVKARHLASLRDALAKTPQQAEAVPSDVVRMDWIAMHGSFGVDSVTGLPGGNGQKRIAATRAAIDAATAQGEKP